MQGNKNDVDDGHIAVDLYPFVRQYEGGHLKRLLRSSFVEASEDAAANRGVATRDVVIDHTTGRVAITAQNHGFALVGEAGEEFDTPFGRAIVSHTCANVGVVEGIKLVSGRAFSVQYHPEAAAGPHDAEYLFDQFVDLMSGEGR